MKNGSEKDLKEKNQSSEVEAQIVVYCDKHRSCCADNKYCEGTFYSFPSGDSVLQHCGC
ncbi:hypothetical protein NSS60_01550 [Anoxybacillus sp. FSL W8-0382]|uniref:hypothetical protein n=1 Tax=Anoxybacillus TaxID=150247 RepID=UPI000A9F285A|nr:hypothetical protein [Anoxybacillus flavithermus]MBE2906506.1 hypothetical protein [Anoxybacillus flavithermus]MBE2911647.1 hypothetical protein [Anoxybacillus flavithermus]MBE2914457.1 hypothetical protein [Anoxybacillus flavithermus]MBE2916863.1 hypothetical protein [Anoxybacillus flavithermus]MBE2920199.1 hypothetical protein [Anoxybacillus flavithermus]